jgi:ABC-type spermidine/putrescine transport system permease subunit I
MIQSAVEEYPSELISHSAVAGVVTVGAIGRHVVPAIASSIFAAVILGSVNALGFYLVPSFVGQGHVSTLATAIDHAVNHIGDWQAACQLAVVALATQLVLLASAGGIRWAWTSSILGWRS